MKKHTMNNIKKEKGAAAILAVMVVLIASIFFITNMTKKLELTQELDSFFQKNSEIRKYVKDIKKALNNTESCKGSLKKISSEITEIKNIDNEVLLKTYQKGETDSSIIGKFYKKLKIAKMQLGSPEIDEDGNIKGADTNSREVLLNVHFATKDCLSGATKNCTFQKKSIPLLVELKSPDKNDIKSCSSAPPALGTLDCAALRAKISCCLFVYSINIEEGEVGDEKEKSLSPNLNLNPNPNPNSNATNTNTNANANANNTNTTVFLINENVSGNPGLIPSSSNLQSNIDECKEREEAINGTINARCERGTWNWSGECTS